MKAAGLDTKSRRPRAKSGSQTARAHKPRSSGRASLSASLTGEARPQTARLRKCQQIVNSCQHQTAEVNWNQFKEGLDHKIEAYRAAADRRPPTSSNPPVCESQGAAYSSKHRQREEWRKREPLTWPSAPQEHQQQLPEKVSLRRWLQELEGSAKEQCEEAQRGGCDLDGEAEQWCGALHQLSQGMREVAPEVPSNQ